MLNTGYFVACAAVVLWGLLLATNKVMMGVLGMPPLLYTALLFVYGGMALALCNTRFLTLAETWQHPLTWAYGLGRVVHLGLYNMCLVAITATEAEFANRISLVFAMVLGYIFFRKRPHGAEWLGLGIVLACYGGFMWHIGQSHLWVVGLMTLASFLNAALAFMIQCHPVSQKTEGVANQSAFTGGVVLVSALFFLSALFVAEAFGLGSVNLMASFDSALVVATVLVGVFLLAPVTYTTFLSIKLIGADNMLMAGTLIPFVAIGFESILSFFGLVDLTTFSAKDMLLGIGITAGALWIMGVRIKRETRESSEHTDEGNNA